MLTICIHRRQCQTSISSYNYFTCFKEKMSLKSGSFFFFVVLLFCNIDAISSAFLAPLTKDFSTKRYTITVYLNTPPQPANLLLDLGASFTILDCTNYTSVSSSNTHAFAYPACHTTKPPMTGRPAVGPLYLPTTNGRNPGQLGSIPRFVFSCGERYLLKSLVKVKGATGLAGLGRSDLSIQAQVGNSLSDRSPVFALCLSGSPSAPGVGFFGSSGPFYFYPEIDLSQHLNYTQLVKNRFPKTKTMGFTNPSNEYYINLTSIRVNGKDIDFDRRVALLETNKKGRGGTRLSTVTPYTTLQSEIYGALTDAFVKESAALNLSTTDPVKPFKICYDADDVVETQVGPSVPTIDLVLGGVSGASDDQIIWRIFGANSMVRIFRDDVDVWCLGFLNGGDRPRTSVVIGGYQMEDNLLLFDVEKERLGFSSSVRAYGTMCANFNFTT